MDTLEYATLLTWMKHLIGHLWLEGEGKDHNYHPLCYTGFLLTTPFIKDMQAVVMLIPAQRRMKNLRSLSLLMYALVLWMGHQACTLQQGTPPSGPQ